MSSSTEDLTEPRGTAEQEGAVSAYLEALHSGRGVAVEEARRLRDGFVDHAQAYGAAHGIEYETWIEVGVPSRVLRAAGITNPA